jgi:MinD-like ATPase involved in chromosome partitioning or flagellar assembly
MLRAHVAVDPPHGERLAEELAREGVHVTGVGSAGALDDGILDAGIDVLVLEASRPTLTARLVTACDARGVRIAPLAGGPEAAPLAAGFGLSAPLPVEVEGWILAETLTAPPQPARHNPAPPRGRVLTVWGPHGAPGRSTVAIELAAELSRGGGRVALVDADAHAPSLALALGLADEGPGFAAACRAAERGELDAAELERISIPLSVAGGRVDVLTGINRPSRWPELGEARVGAVLSAARQWADLVVVDVAASLERDEEIMSDLDGPRRNAATLSALRSADTVVAVCAADPVGVARFVRAHTDLRSVVGTTPVSVVVNRLRAGTVGIDARGQIRRTLERFAGLDDVAFLPLDPRSADAALLAARPVADVAPRSPLAAAVRRYVGDRVVPAPMPAARTRTRRGARVGAARLARTA